MDTIYWILSPFLVILFGAGSIFTYFFYYYKIVLPLRISQLVDTKTNVFPENNGKPRGSSIPFGDFLSLFANTWSVFNSWRTSVGLKFVWMMNEPWVVISDPNIAKHVLHTNKDSNWKREFNASLITKIEGESIIAATGEHWVRQHRIISKAFGTKIIQGFVPDMYQISQEWLVPQIEQSIDTKQPINMLKTFANLAMAIVVGTTVGVKSNKITSIMEHFFFLTGSLSNPLTLIPGWLSVPTPHNRKLDRSFAALDKIIYKIIETRKKERETLSESEKQVSRTLVDLLIEAVDESNGSKLSDIEVRDNMMTFFLAGSESTATAMSWFLFHMCTNPIEFQKVKEEVDRVVGSKPVSVEDLKQLTYLEASIKEALRLTPTNIGTPPRIAKKTEVVGPWSIPKGVQLTVCFPALHHHPDYWTDSWTYKPERFLPPNAQQINDFAYMPFGRGSRNCLGKTFAMQELLIVMTIIIQNYHFELESPYISSTKEPKINFAFPFLQPTKEGAIYLFKRRVVQ